MTTDIQAPTGTEKPGNRLLFGGVMAVLLIAIVLLLNWLGTAAAPIRPEQFQRLLDRGAIVAIEIASDGLHCGLDGPVLVESQGHRTTTDEVFLAVEAPPDESVVTGWRVAGIHIQRQAPGEARARGIGGVALVALLLGLGFWHLWAQVQQDRHGGGSPRRRLQELKDALDAGQIDQEQYKQQAEAIWAEM